MQGYMGQTRFLLHVGHRVQLSNGWDHACFQIRLCNNGTVLKGHLNQLRPRCGTEEDTEPGLDMVTEPFLSEAQPTQETLVP